MKTFLFLIVLLLFPLSASAQTPTPEPCTLDHLDELSEFHGELLDISVELLTAEEAVDYASAYVLADPQEIALYRSWSGWNDCEKEIAFILIQAASFAQDTGMYSLLTFTSAGESFTELASISQDLMLDKLKEAADMMEESIDAAMQAELDN